MIMTFHTSGDTMSSGLAQAALPIASGARIVIVDDDPGVRELLTEFLVENGFGAEGVANGAALRERLERRDCDLIVLDIMMPGEDGLSVLRSLMHVEDGPGIIMFSAISNEIDRIVALEMGADDYILKPSSPREIMARIRSVLRRRAATAARGTATGIGQATTPPTDCFGFAGWTFDARRRKLTAPSGAIVAVTETEYRMLAIFLRDPQIVHSRENLADLTGRDSPTCNDRTIDVHVSRLRRKLSANGGDEIIRTVRNRGYLFLPRVEARVA
ncbi:response regulator transcription factor [Sphingomonas sp. CARO-RG-8B-R24-01]|uniref:response regulator n=1 Tax=Sphingomonas sp. CARO-RG-8B-R24-01 TaxID=2914831 RepID=UPI001F570DCF|nr:response regulator transcription factor [Sphingomonas sp. CARO-RG-8B-R24-01]